MAEPIHIRNFLDRPTKPAAMRLEAARLRFNARAPDRIEEDRALDLMVAEALEGIADNKEFLGRQRMKLARRGRNRAIRHAHRPRDRVGTNRIG